MYMSATCCRDKHDMRKEDLAKQSVSVGSYLNLLSFSRRVLVAPNRSARRNRLNRPSLTAAASDERLLAIPKPSVCAELLTFSTVCRAFAEFWQQPSDVVFWPFKIDFPYSGSTESVTKPFTANPILFHSCWDWLCRASWSACKFTPKLVNMSEWRLTNLVVMIGFNAEEK